MGLWQWAVFVHVLAAADHDRSVAEAAVADLLNRGVALGGVDLVASMGVPRQWLEVRTSAVRRLHAVLRARSRRGWCAPAVQRAAQLQQQYVLPTDPAHMPAHGSVMLPQSHRDLRMLRTVREAQAKRALLGALLGARMRSRPR